MLALTINEEDSFKDTLAHKIPSKQKWLAARRARHEAVQGIGRSGRVNLL